MKKIILIISMLVIIMPVFASAHGSMMDFGDLQTGPQMMEYMEDQALGSDIHEEMEELMLSMMSGSLTQEEVSRLTQLMNQHPGPYATMMNRIGIQNWMGSGMMGGTWWFWWLWLIPLSGIIWLAIGILVIVWLWKQIQKK